MTNFLSSRHRLSLNPRVSLPTAILQQLTILPHEDEVSLSQAIVTASTRQGGDIVQHETKAAHEGDNLGRYRDTDCT